MSLHPALYFIKSSRKRDAITPIDDYFVATVHSKRMTAGKNIRRKFALKPIQIRFVGALFKRFSSSRLYATDFFFLLNHVKSHITMIDRLSFTCTLRIPCRKSEYVSAEIRRLFIRRSTPIVQRETCISIVGDSETRDRVES